MAHKKHKSSRAALKDLMTVAFAEDIELAKQYKELLNENDIPAVVKTSRSKTKTGSIAVMVPEEYLDEAHVIIHSHSSFGDFYDLAFDDGLYSDDIDESDFYDPDDDF